MKTKGNLFFLFILISNFYLNAQNLLLPDLKTSYGNNKHTNRDISYFTHIDSNDNVISISTTERDSTFTDILVTKLDSNLNEIWQKRRSYDTGLSYDIPLNTFVDQNDNTYVVVRSTGDNSYSNGFMYVLKYDINGNEVWSINIDDYVNAYGSDFFYQKVFFESNGNFKIVYIKPESPTASNNNFLSFDNSGSLVDSFIQNTIIPTDPNDDFTGLNTEFYYFNGDFYLRHRRHNITNLSNTFYEHYIAKITPNLTEVYDLNPYIDIGDTGEFFKSLLLVDQSSNIYLTYQSDDFDKYILLKLNSSGNLVYFKESLEDLNKEVKEIYLNGNNNLTLLCNSKPNVNSGNQILNVVEYDDNGVIVNDFNDSSTFINGVRVYENEILVYSIGDFKLYDYNFSLLNNYQGNYYNFNDYELNDESNIVISKTTNASMYSGSDFQTQQNIEIDKIDSSQVLNSYMFSGIGTSRVSFQEIMVDNLDNSIVFVHEKLGPENFSIGGSNPPVQKTIYKYDPSLNLLWSINLNNFLTNSHGSSIVIDDNNDIYINTLIAYNASTTSELVKISSDGNIIFQVPSILSKYMFLDQNNNVNVVSPYPQYFNNSFQDYTSIYTFSNTNGSFLYYQQFDDFIFLNQHISVAGDSYLYMYYDEDNYEDITPKLRLYKNNNLESEITLNVIDPDDPNLAYSGEIDENGSIYFRTHEPYYDEWKIHKFSTDGGYISSVLSEGFRLFYTGNNKVYARENDSDIVILDSALNLINTVTHEYNSASRIVKVGNYFFIKYYYDDIAYVINQSAEEVGQFNLPYSFASSVATSDSQDNLVLTGSFGKQISNFQEYSWTRGFLHKYNFSSFNLSINSNQVKEKEFKIYPNPAKNRLYITNLDDVKKIEIFNLSGERVLTFDNFTYDGLDISNLSNGLYFVKIQNEESSHTQKLIKN